MSRKSGNRWGTKKCGRCGESHLGYSGKLDANNVEYVVCGVTNKRMNIQPRNAQDILYGTVWEKEEDE